MRKNLIRILFCLAVFPFFELGGGALQDLASSLKVLAEKVKDVGGVGVKNKPPQKSLMVIDDKVNNGVVATVLANFCWLTVVEPVVKRKKFVGSVDVEQAGLALLYALALFQEADISLLTGELGKQAEDKTNESFAAGMKAVKEKLLEMKSKAEADPDEAAAEIINLFTQTQWNDFLRDFFILLFKQPLEVTGVFQGQSALFTKAMSFPLVGDGVIASYAYAFGVILERLKLNNKNVNTFYQFLKNIIGQLGSKSKESQKRLEPLLKILEMSKGWDAAAFKKEEEVKAVEKESLDDKISAMVMRAFFDELFFNGDGSVAHFSELISGDNAEKIKSDCSYFELVSFNLVVDSQRGFFKFLPLCKTLFKNMKTFENVEIQLREKNKKQVDGYLSLVENMYKGTLSSAKLDLYRKTIGDTSKKVKLHAGFPDMALRAVYALIDGLITFYAPVKKKECVEDICEPGYMHLKFKTTQTTPFIKAAPNGMPLFEAPVYNTQKEELEVGPDRNVYWDEQVLRIVVKTVFRFFIELLKAVDAEGELRAFQAKLLRDFRFLVTKPFPEEFLGSEALMRVKTMAADEFEKTKALFAEK